MPMNIGLGPDGRSPPLPSNDLIRVARQAIRSQVTAREYIERQLAQAQSAIEELQTKLRHVHHEREVAVSAAQSAIAARDIAERSMRAAESALTSERANRARIEGMLRDAETTIRDLREKLATANQTVQVEKATERLNHQSADDGVIALVQPPPTVIAPLAEPLAIVSPAVFAVTPVSGRSVGRPRKLESLEPISTLMTHPKKARVSSEVITKVAKPKQQDQRPRADDQEPVQWWVEGWKNK